jgi:hypothetical protein
MKKFLIVFAGVLLLMGLLGLAFQPGLANDRYQGQPPDEIVPVNGTAYWATTPTGPDFEGVQLIPFQASNPTRQIFDLSMAQIQPYLSAEFYIENIQVSHSGMISGASNYVNDFSEVMVAIDPTDPNHLLGSSKFFYNPASYDFYTGVFQSFDGGLTWEEEQPAAAEDYSLTSDPVNTFDDQGNGYFTLLTRGPTGLDMLKQPAGGGSWIKTVVDRTTSTDKQWIIGDQNPQGISPYAGNLYMSWTSFGGPVTGIVFSRSTDGNQTWSSPIELTDGDIQGSVPGVAPDGTVYVVYGRSISTGRPRARRKSSSPPMAGDFQRPGRGCQYHCHPLSIPRPVWALDALPHPGQHASLCGQPGQWQPVHCLGRLPLWRFRYLFYALDQRRQHLEPAGAPE